MIVLSALHLNAQDSLRKRKVYIGFTFSSAHYRAFFPGLPAQSSEIQERFPYRFGIDLKIKLTQQLNFTTGLLFDATSFVYDVKYDYTPSATSPKTNPIGYKIIRKSYSMGVPLRLDLKFINANISPFATVGFFPSYYVGSDYRIIQTYEDGHEEKDGYNNLFKGADSYIKMNYQIGAGIDINVNRFKFQVYPLYEFGFLTRFSPAYYYHRIGGAISTSYGF
ncbi:MAG: outer membrane beta-barrel protein [Bacteroidetes bacterium]|nr:outer membrane beta-barrel protein [Bacteroidota bacterium]